MKETTRYVLYFKIKEPPSFISKIVAVQREWARSKKFTKNKKNIDVPERTSKFEASKRGRRGVVKREERERERGGGENIYIVSYLRCI